MAKGSTLPEATTITGMEDVIIVQNGVTKRTKARVISPSTVETLDNGDVLVCLDGSDDQIILFRCLADGTFKPAKWPSEITGLILRVGGDVTDGSGDLLQVLDNTEDGVYLLRITSAGVIKGKVEGVDPAAVSTALANAAAALTTAAAALGIAQGGARKQLMRDLACRARGNNRFELAAMSAPPTVTTVTSLPGDLTSSYLPGSYNGGWNVLGGEPMISGDFVGVKSVSYPAGQGNLGSGVNALHWSVEFTSDAPRLAIRVNADPTSGWFRLHVDGQFVTKTFTQINAAGGLTYIVLDFAGVRQARTITLDCIGNSKFGGVVVTKNDEIFAPSTGDLIRACWVGDSFIEGLSHTAGYTPGSTWPHATSARLGWRNVRLAAIGGTGYQYPGTRWKWGDHAADWLGWAPDILLFVGSVNNGNTDVNTEADEALRVWREARAALPNVPIVIGGLMSDPAYTGLVSTQENLLAARFATFADPNSLFIPIATDPLGPWVRGNGSVEAPTGNGNSDIYRNGTTHLNEFGDLQLAAPRFASKLRSWISTF
jgi:hypothetical protein